MRTRVALFAAALFVLPPAIDRGLQAAPADPPVGSVLHLVNDSTIPGQLLASTDANVIRWRSPLFTEPLEFPLSAVKSVHYDAPATPPRPKDEYGIELVNDDVVYGDLVRLADDELELNSSAHGRLRLKRDQVCRIYRLAEAAAVYAGPNGLTGWKDPADPTQWREEAGQILTDHQGATLFSDLHIPDKAAIELELSWRSKPDFTLAFAVTEQERVVRNGFRFEVWDGQVVVVGESSRDADAAVIAPAAAGGGRIRVLVYLDQAQRRLILVSRAGKLLGTLNIAAGTKPKQPPRRAANPLDNFLGALNAGGPKVQQPTGLRLTNFKGDVRLETLRVARWSGVTPQDVRDDQSRLHRTDGSIVYGQVAAYDPQTKQFTVRGGGAETAVAHDAFTDIFLAPAGKQSAAAVPPVLRVVYQDGSRFSGTPTRIEDDRVTLSCRGMTDPIQLPLAGARSLVSLVRVERQNTQAEGRPGRLELEGLSLKGRLVAGPGALNWQPDLALKPSPLVPGVSGRINYRPPVPTPPKPPAVTTQRVVAGVGMVIINGQVVQPPAPPTGPPLPTTGTKSMHLRTGDTIPCEVVRIDEKGVTFKTPNSDATFVTHDKIKSVELLGVKDGPAVDEAKRDRLLTLPRMQKDLPPTHLICSKNGDFLRGRIVEMDDARLKVDVRLETREIPRDRVAQIIWLHADELGDAKTSPPAADAPRDTRAQTINSKGNRLTFVVSRADAKTIYGTSEVLGACRADLAEVDEMLFGNSIEQSVAKLAYNDWRLHHAPEPKFVQADANGGEGAASGLESPLVGKPAPTFQLEALDGSNFRLADRKGKSVVVLDFWATWCGPCMQSMPLVEETIRGFADRGVELLAVNMEEQPDQVKAILERHKFKVPVAIDRDGAVAAKYEVTAIPQTVVIDRDGKVARLFVGGGKGTAEALKKALEELSAK